MGKRGSETKVAAGTCFAVPLRDGRFTACQVLGHSADGGVEVIALNWLSQAPPTLEDLAESSVLVLSHHAWENKPQRLVVTGEPPPAFRALGVREPLARFEDAPRSYGAWEGLGGQILLQRWWDEEVPKEETRAYAHAVAHRGESVVFELAGQQHEVRLITSKARIGPDSRFPAPLDTQLDWSALDILGGLNMIEYAGRDAGVVDYIARRVLIEELHWHAHGQERIDLSKVRLRKLVLDVEPQLTELVLPSGALTVSLVGYRGQSLRVRHPEAGRGVALMLHDLTEGVPPPIAGLEHLESLGLAKPEQLVLAEVGYPHLRTLTATLGSGGLRDPDAMVRFEQLESLRLHDVYAMDPERFPEGSTMPALLGVTIHGLRKTYVPVLEKRLAGKRVQLTGAKTDAWLAKNADNPFNDWVDESETLAKAACRAYSKSVTAIRKLKADDREGFHREMVAFVAVFNRIACKHEIDTIRREHIYGAFFELAKHGPSSVDTETLEAWFDEDRGF